MSEYSQTLRGNYEAKRSLYEQFTSRNEALLREVFVEGEDFQTIEARTKDLDSFEGRWISPRKNRSTAT